MRDETLQTIARLSRTFGPAARRILAERVSGLQESTATLTDLTRRLEADNDSTRSLLADGHQQPAPEDAALDELRERFGA